MADSTQHRKEILASIQKRFKESKEIDVNLGLMLRDERYCAMMLKEASRSGDIVLQSLAEEVKELPRNSDENEEALPEEPRHDDKPSAATKGSSTSPMLQSFFNVEGQYFGMGAIILLAILSAGYFITQGGPPKTVEQLSEVERVKLFLQARSKNPIQKEYTSQGKPTVTPETVLRLHGSQVMGETLVPRLAVGYLRAKGGKNIKVIPGKGNGKKVLAEMPNRSRPVAIEILSSNSTRGFMNLGLGRTDVSMSSRKITSTEVQNLESRHGNLATPAGEHVIALDGLAIIVHPTNKLSNLTVEQLAMIFSGKFTSWPQVGGEPGPIKVHVRDANSGTADSFKHLVLDRHSVGLKLLAKQHPDEESLSDAVSGDPNGIGYVSLPNIRIAKVLAVSDAADTKSVTPTSFTVGTEDYPMSRRLYLYSPAKAGNRRARGIVAFALSSKGQEIVKQAGYISQNIYGIKLALPNSAPADYKKLTSKAQRLSISFRFRTDSKDLDSKAIRDMQRLILYFRRNPSQQPLLFGFTDSVGVAEINLNLSTERVQTIQRYLETNGISPFAATGFGSAMPIASNHDNFGRLKNRRVEVWVQ